MTHSQDHWARYDLWDERHLSLDRFAVEDPENGFCAAASPHDPKPSLVIENGRIVEMDGVPASEFDMIDEFIARRTEPDRQAILHRYGLILASNAGDIARQCPLPVHYLSGFVDPVVPWPFVLPSLRKCPGFRGWRIIFNADHNVLATAPKKSLEQILRWMNGL